MGLGRRTLQALPKVCVRHSVPHDAVPNQMCSVVESLCCRQPPGSSQPATTQPDCPTSTHTRVCSKPPFPAPHRNMITDGQTKVNNSEVCINDDGFGYASEGEC